MGLTPAAPTPATTTRPGGERGLINLGLLLVTTVFALFVILGIARVALATNSAQHNQNAADAAALAAAGAFEKAGAYYFAPGFSGSQELRDKVMVAGACPGQVRADAATYASKNGSTLSSCRMLRWGEVEVSVTREVPIDGADRGRASARAHWDLTWDSCSVDPAFVAPVTGSGMTWMQCGPTRFDLKHAAGRFFLHPWGQVKTEINPRLTD